jgi:hypothetical protein
MCRDFVVMFELKNAARSDTHGMASPASVALKLALPSLRRVMKYAERMVMERSVGGFWCRQGRLPVLDAKNDKAVRCKLAGYVTVSDWKRDESSRQHEEECSAIQGARLLEDAR